MSDIQIIVQGYSTSVNEWARADQALKQELPQLTQEQKAFARRYGIPEERYARKVLAGQYGQEKLRTEAERFARSLEAAVAELKNERGFEVEIEMVVYTAIDREFTCHLREGSKEFTVQISSVKVADHLESGDPALEVRLRQQLKGFIQDARAQAVGASR